MKPIFTEVIVALTMGLLLPALILGAAVTLRDDTVDETIPAEHPQETGETLAEGEKLTISFRTGELTVVTMDMDEYLVGVVCAEMPASFAPEALKAQAVVARTYALKMKTMGDKHGDGSVCADHTCCQAYVDEEGYLARGNTPQDYEKIRRAVYETSGYVLTYEGELIEATYFSCSGGITEDAAAVWGSDYPYLRSTPSPGEENAAYYTDSIYISKQTLCEALGIRLNDSPETWFGLATYTAGGGVNTMVIGGEEFRGTYLRIALGLRSTLFSVEADSGGATFTTRGYGHRVGMSQYGADAMAESGSDFARILAHYYRGTELTVWVDN